MNTQQKPRRRKPPRPSLRRAENQPRLLARSVRRMTVTCGCGQYTSNCCGINQAYTGSGCGQYTSNCCGINQAYS